MWWSGRPTPGVSWPSWRSANGTHGLKGLRVGHNNVFGYYLEVPRAQADRVPGSTSASELVNAERFFTEELKALEADIQGSGPPPGSERELWADPPAAGGHAPPADLSRALAVLMSSALAEVAQTRSYCRPQVDDSDRIQIREGRHRWWSSTRAGSAQLRT